MLKLFTCLITLQFLVVAFHDLVDIPGWTHGAQVSALIGRRKLLLVTMVNSIFPGIAVVLAFYFWNRPRPAFVSNYWLAYCAITFLSAIVMWYIPYFFGTDEERKREFQLMYTGTIQVFPARGDNPRPNLLHLCFHVLFVINMVLVLLLRYRNL